MVWSGPAAGIMQRLALQAAELARGLLESMVEESDRMSAWVWGSNAFAAVFAAVLFSFICLLVVVVVMWPFGWAYLTLKGVFPASLADRRRYRLVPMLSGAIRACAECREVRGEARIALLEQNLFGQLANVESYILRAHLTRSDTGMSTHRRHALKKHARLVVARRRKAQDGIDHDPDGALKELAGLLLTVQARYAEGRTGALLDRKDTQDIAEELKEFEPIQSRGILRLVVASVLTVAGVVGIAQLELPEMAEGPAALFVAIVASALVYRVPQKVEERASLLVGS